MVSGLSFGTLVGCMGFTITAVAATFCITVSQGPIQIAPDGLSELKTGSSTLLAETGLGIGVGVAV
jgi:hypothetical protein